MIAIGWPRRPEDCNGNSVRLPQSRPRATLQPKNAPGVLIRGSSAVSWFSLGPALDSLGALLNAVLVWVGARPQRTVHVKIGESEIDICGATSEESRELIRVFVQNQRQTVEDRSKAKPVEKGKHK